MIFSENFKYLHIFEGLIYFHFAKLSQKKQSAP